MAFDTAHRTRTHRFDIAADIRGLELRTILGVDFAMAVTAFHVVGVFVIPDAFFGILAVFNRILWWCGEIMAAGSRAGIQNGMVLPGMVAGVTTVSHVP